MEEMNEEDTSEINSFPVGKVLRANITDVNKKRKFLDELLGLPPPKHKFRGRICGSVQRPEAEEVLVWHGTRGIVIKEWLPEDSEMDCNSFIEESESSTSQSNEDIFQSNIVNAFARDQEPTFEPGFRELCGGSQLCSSSTKTSSFSGAYSSSNFETSEDRTIEVEETSEKEGTLTIFKDQKPRGMYTNFSGHGGDEIEEFLDIESEDTVLYSNAATSSDLFVLSSGRWNINRDADGRPGVTKPTIDQEFEQYFSTLML